MVPTIQAKSNKKTTKQRSAPVGRTEASIKFIHNSPFCSDTSYKLKGHEKKEVYSINNRLTDLTLVLSLYVLWQYSVKISGYTKIPPNKRYTIKQNAKLEIILQNNKLFCRGMLSKGRKTIC